MAGVWVNRPSKRHRTWRVHFTDHQGEQRSIQGFQNKRASERLGRSLEELANLVASGADVPDHMARWLREQLDERRRAKLIEFGMLGLRQMVSGAPLVDHLEVWRKHLLAIGRDVRYAEEQHHKATLVLVDRCGFESITDIDPMRVIAETAALARERVWSKRTESHHIKSCKAMTAWLVRFGRAARDPLVVVSPPKVKPADVKRPRRALTVDEAVRLVETVNASTKRRGWMLGPERALIYRLVLFETGFRAGTIRGLRVCDLDLAGQPPTITGHIKGDRYQTLPLGQTMTGLLAEFIEGRDGDERLFNAPTVSWFADMLKGDLAEAGIPFETHAGRVDFHAQRTSFSTIASRVMDPRTLQEYMGHRDIRVTMQVYTHRLQSDLSRAKELMPECGAECGAAVRQTDKDRQRLTSA